MKKLLTILLATICLFALCACNSDSNQGSNPTGSNPIKVGVVQTTQHPALDAATQGFVDALKENGITDVDVQNASGESAGYSKATKARLDSTKLNLLGWHAKYDIKTGVYRTLDILNSIE